MDFLVWCIYEQITLYINQAELKAFLGVLLFSGYHKIPQEHWQQFPDARISLIYNTIPKRRFEEIKKNLTVPIISSKCDSIYNN